MAKIELFKIHI